MLKDYVVLFVDPNDPLTVEGFLCEAEDADHAEEQAVDAYPDCDVVWIEEGDDWGKVQDNYFEYLLTN
jgi:hypothetical protein